jgi:hypothetical protein
VKALEITVEEGGVLRLPPGVSVPPKSRLAVLVIGSSESQANDLSGVAISGFADQSGAFDFLKEEPEIYQDGDILPERQNPRFRK